MATALDTATVTIANGASLSGAATITRGFALVGIEMPAAWTAATITLQVATATGASATFNNVYDTAGELALSQPAASRFLALPATLLLGAVQVKVRSGTSGAAVNQGAARDVKLVFREV